VCTGCVRGGYRLWEKGRELCAERVPFFLKKRERTLRKEVPVPLRRRSLCAERCPFPLGEKELLRRVLSSLLRNMALLRRVLPLLP